MKILKRISSFIGTGARAFVALVGVAGITAAVANYAMTQGAGTNFGSVVVGGVHYAQQFICDLTTPAQCASVSAGGAIKVDNSGVTQPVSAVSWPLPTGAATQATLATLVTTMGSPFQAGGSIGNTSFASTQSGTWNINNISGTISLPTGAATQASLASLLGVSGTTADNACPAGTSTATELGCLRLIYQAALGANPVNVNTVVTAQTGLTPGATATSQTGTIVAANVDLSSQAGVALAAPTAYGTAPSGRALSANAAVTSINAGETHVGEIGSNQIAVSVAATVTASAYSAGNALGGLQTIANAARVSGSLGAAGTGGILTGMNVSSKALQSGVQIDIFLFNANPSGSTCTDKTAFVLAAADANKVVGVITVPSTPANGGGWFGGGTGSIAMSTYYPVTYDLASATSLFACGVVRAAITPASTSDISYNYNILRN